MRAVSPSAGQRRRARTREDTPVLTVIGGDGATVDCRSYRAHQTTHYRAADGAWHCPTCSPEEDPA